MIREIYENTVVNMFANDLYKNDYLFYAHIVSKCNVVFRDAEYPAAVSFTNNQYNLYISNKFAEFKLIQRLAILKHEVLHIINYHVPVKDNLNITNWNYATDCAINQLINEEHLPNNCILPHNFPVPCDKNLTSVQYYELLKENKEEFPKDLSHEMWDESDGDANYQKELTKSMIEKSVNDTLKSKGKLPNDINDILEIYNNDKVNWKALLRNIIGNKKSNRRKTIMRKDRRFPNRADLRGTTKDRTFNLLVVLDVSGSVRDESLQYICSEVKNICDLTNTDLTAIQVDTKAYEPTKITKNMSFITRQGSGGTRLYPAVQKAIDEKIDFDAIVVGTDGELFSDDIRKFRELNKKILWLITPDGTLSSMLESDKMCTVKLEK